MSANSLPHWAPATSREGTGGKGVSERIVELAPGVRGECWATERPLRA